MEKFKSRCFRWSQVISLSLFTLHNASHIILFLRTYEGYQQRQLDKKGLVKKNSSKKTEFVRDYIIKYANQANPIADKNGVNTAGKAVKELPFRSTLDFYNEFQSSFVAEGFAADLLPGKTTFKTVVRDKQHMLPCELRFLRCKGAHASCEICVNASKLLENKSKKLDKEGKCAVI